MELHPWNQSAFVGLLLNFTHLINARNIENIQLILTVAFYRSRSMQRQHFVVAIEYVFRSELLQPFKDEAQTALFKDPVRTAL